LADAVFAFEPLFRGLRSLSFAQYGEDALLAGCVAPRNKGFYVDVGAYHPWRQSLTYKLYLRGWSGLTVEPNPAAERLFRRYRPRDIHFPGGVAATDERLTYYCFLEAKMNTFAADLAEAYEKSGLRPLGVINIPCRPLQAIIDELAPGCQIDLLNIDCEGFDFTTLRTLDFARNRPTVLLIEDHEAFERLKAGSLSSGIESFLRQLGYMRVSQAMYTSFYVDIPVARSNSSKAFNLTEVQTPLFAPLAA